MSLSRLTNAILILIASIIISSCTITEEVWIEKNGSGRYQMQMDLGQMLPMIAMMDTTGGLDDVETKDTVIHFSAFSEADSFDLSEVERPELLEKVSVRIKMNMDNSEMIMSLATDFDYLEQITEIFQQVSKIKNLKKEKSDNPTSMDNILDLANEDGIGMTWRKGKLSRTEQTMDNDDMKKLGGSEMDEGEMAMMESMFGGMEYKTIVHLPGKIKKVSDPNAVIEGKKTVIFTYDLAEILKKGKYGAFEISYK